MVEKVNSLNMKTGYLIEPPFSIGVDYSNNRRISVILDPKDFFFDVLKRSYNGFIDVPKYSLAFEKEKNLVTSVIDTSKMKLTLDDIVSIPPDTTTRGEMIFHCMQMIESDENKYFLGMEKKRKISIMEAVDDYCFDKLLAVAYRGQLKNNPVDTLIYHVLWLMRHEIITDMQHKKRYDDCSFENCSKMFVDDPVLRKNQSDERLTRAEAFYRNFQNNAQSLIEEKYMPLRLEIISKEENDVPVDEDREKIVDTLILV